MFSPSSIERCQGRVSLRTVALAGGFTALVLLGLGVLGTRSADRNEEEPVFEVARGPLRISTAVAGQVKAKDQVVISSELEGQNAILFIQPEGTRVRKGDLLIELDASTLVDNRVDQQIRVQNAEAAYVSARENLAVVKNQAQSDVDQAELDLQFARQDFEKYREGELPREIKAAQAAITLAEEELSRAEEKHKWSEVLFNEKYLSQTELQADALAANKARLELELAQNDLDLLMDYTSKKTLAELESGVSQAEMALERTRRKANADVVQAEANLQARQLEFEREQGKLEKLEEQITKARIHAPTDGLVVYATSSQMSWRGEEPLAEGQMVRERQALIHLPTTETYKAEVSVHESYLDKLEVGLPAVLSMDALPGKQYRGRVESIAPLPDAQSMFLNPDLKVYDTEISIQGDNPEIRSGMSCQAEIILAQYEDALYIPVQAVIRVNGTPTVYVRERGEWEPRAIGVGLDNNRVIRVIEGLEEGEEVLLTPPLAAATESVGPRMDEPLEVDSPGEVASGSGSAEGSSEDGESSRDRPVPESRPEEPVNGQSMRAPFENMSDEQREAMRQRFQNMSPEQREALRSRFGGANPNASGGGNVR